MLPDYLLAYALLVVGIETTEGVGNNPDCCISSKSMFEGEIKVGACGDTNECHAHTLVGARIVVQQLDIKANLNNALTN